MFCPSCGANNDEGARFCKDCGGALPQAGSLQPAQPEESTAPAPLVHVPNYLVQAVLVTVFCCQPFGVVSIVFAAQVNGRVASGDIEGARRMSQDARKWAWLGFWVGLGLAIASILFYVVLIVFLLVVGETSEIAEWM